MQDEATGGLSLDMSQKLRAQARLYAEAAKREQSPHLRKLLTSHSMALTQLAERIDQEHGQALRQKSGKR